MKLGEALYKQQEAGDEGDAEGAADGGAEAASSGGSGDDDVVDADFEEVDDDRKDKSA